MRGKRVLCLTIDPARRLSQSLGLEQLTHEARVVDPALFQAADVTVTGSLTVMRIDTKTTFDELVTSLAPSAEQRDRILNNVLYKYISTSLAGTQEYMAMEKLYAVKGDARYDIILLDTPPTANALDFLDAPERLVGAIDSAAVRWFVQAFQASGKVSFNLVAKSASVILKGIGKLTGSGFLEQVASFLTEINELFGGWRKRAESVASALRGSDVAYVLVTTPDPLSLREVLFFADRLREQQMPRDAFVVNRVHPTFAATVDDLAVASALGQAELPDTPDWIAKLHKAAADESKLGACDQEQLRALASMLERDEASVLRVDVPAYPRDIHDIRGLARVAAILVPG